MKRGKGDEKIMGPLFPRLHVNDTEKGGPRAPPRNKMALYEQLSIPSQRFSSAVVPLRSSSSSNLVPEGSSSQRSRHERNLRFPPHIPPQMPNQLAERFHSRQRDGGNLNTSSVQLEQRKKATDDDDFMVPVFVHSGVGENHINTENDIDREKLIPFRTTHSGASMQFENANDNIRKVGRLMSPSLRQDDMNQCEQNIETEVRVLNGDCSTTSSMNLLNRGKILRSEEEFNASSNPCYDDRCAVDFSRLRESNGCLQQEPTTVLQSNDKCCGDGILDLTTERENGNASQQRSDSCAREFHGSPNMPELDAECHVDKTCGSVQLQNGDKSSDGSEMSMVDTLSAEISPDNVVRMIGQKHFWKARREIVKQQRVFAIQVFELHRLVKVQQLIAGSPELLLEDSTYLGRPSVNVSTPEKVSSEYVINTPTCVPNNKDDSEKSNHKIECSAENAVGKTSFALMKNGCRPSNYGASSGNPMSAPVASDTEMSPSYFHQSFGQQWLIPVMSPSEGLIYKPYTAPGYAGSVYGGCGPFGPPPMTCNFTSPTYGVPGPPNHQGIGGLPGAPLVSCGYYPPYSIPAVNPGISGSAVHPMNCFTASALHGQSGLMSGGGANLNTCHQSSSNFSTQKSGAMPRASKFQSSNDTELQGSTASSPLVESARGVGKVQDAIGRATLPPFRTVPDTPKRNTQVQDSEQPTRVIRVVPHNPGSATESAARIFQCIQEERNQLDSI